MKADHLAFKRAASVSLLGLGLQLVMGLALLVYAVIFRDPAALPGALFILAGSIVWVTLAIVFDQHRRERIEALEADSLAAASARESSVFGERPDDLRVAAKRLAWMHRYLVNASSILYALVLAAIGLWTFTRNRQVLETGQFSSLGEPGWGVGVGIALAIAFVGFIFARWVSALGKQAAWSSLRAGAAAGAISVVVGVGLAAGHAIDHFGTDAVAQAMLIAIPVAMLVISAETVLNFLLGLYRPRRAGEVPRPAFESRILAFIAAPDRIAESIGGALNYQFGFDVTGSWFYQLLSRSLVALLLIGVAVLWLLTSISVVQPNQQGLRVRLGEQVGSTLEPGAYLKLPWPFERIDRFDATTVRRVDLGSETPKVPGSILWTNDHGVNEVFFIVQPNTPGGERAAATGSNDVSMVSAEVPLLYSVIDYAAYERFAAPDQREAIIQGVARREVFKHLATEGLGSVLGRGRTVVSSALRDRVEAALDRLNAGVKVLHVAVEGVHPPKDTAELFEEVVQSLQKRAGGIANAQREANDRLIQVAGSVDQGRSIVAAIDAFESARRAGAPADELAQLELAASELIADASGSAADLLNQAKADRWRTHMDARGRAELYAGQLASYTAGPAVYMAEQYFDTLRRIVADTRVYIVGSDAAALEIRSNLEDAGISANLFDRPKGEGE